MLSVDVWFVAEVASDLSWKESSWYENMSSTAVTTKPKTEMTDQELAALEEAEFQTGPLSLLTQVLNWLLNEQVQKTNTMNEWCTILPLLSQ